MNEVRNAIADLENDERYLSNKLIESYAKITRLHKELSAKKEDISFKNDLCVKHLKFTQNLVDITVNGGTIDKDLLFSLINEHCLAE